jgi:hypothetical protein
VAVNISPRQLRDPNFVNTVTLHLCAGIDLAQTELEITETMLTDDQEAAIPHYRWRACTNSVSMIAIDDSGTGYSSLDKLKRSLIDTIKVDRSSIMDIPGNADDKAITAAVDLDGAPTPNGGGRRGRRDDRASEVPARTPVRIRSGYFPLFRATIAVRRNSTFFDPNVALLQPRKRPTN